MLILVLAINFLGTVYGYYWYLPQLLETPARFLIFVPDSPTATFFLSVCAACLSHETECSAFRGACASYPRKVWPMGGGYEFSCACSNW